MKVQEIKLAFETNVQFALIDDIVKINNEAMVLSSKGASSIDSASNQLKSSIVLLNDANKKNELLLKALQEASQKAKEIGVDLPSDIISKKSFAEKNILSNQKAIQVVSKFITDANLIK